MQSQRGRKPPQQQLAHIGEHGLLDHLRRWFAKDSQGFELGIGDDAAALALPKQGAPLVVSTDTLIEGVHFCFDWTGPRDLGHKALAVNLSDLAAMAARPVAAFLALSLPPETRMDALREFFLGLRTEGRRHGCPLIGGDLTRAPQWCVTLTVLGQPATAVPVLRSSARPGDRLFVTGWPGRSGAGRAALAAGATAPSLVRAHVRPLPRLDEAVALASTCSRLAMMDVSDGLWHDADQLARASGVRVEIDRGALKPTPPMRRLAAQLGADPLHWMLFGGEDYELLFAADPSEATFGNVLSRAGLRTAVTCIGRIRHGEGIALVDDSGRSIDLSDTTFRHF